MSEGARVETAESRKKRRRRLGLAMLLVSIALVLLGQFVFEPYLRSLRLFILYWGGCGLFTVAALFTALIDMVAVRREAAREERRLMEETFANTKAAKQARENAAREENDEE